LSDVTSCEDQAGPARVSPDRRAAPPWTEPHASADSSDERWSITTIATDLWHDRKTTVSCSRIALEPTLAQQDDLTSQAARATLQHFEVATFITLRAGRIGEMIEIWTDVDLTAAQGRRPA
jgi:hypothetical protein